MLFNSSGRVLPAVCLAFIAIACGRTPAEFVESGNAFAAQGKYEEAILEYSNAVNGDGNYAEARFQLARVYLRTNDIVQAVRQFVIAADLAPDNVGYQLEAARAMLLAGRYEDAKARAENVLKREPKNADAQMLKAMGLAGTKDLAAALKEADEAVRIDPANANSYMLLSALHRDGAQIAEAEAALKKAVELQPNAPVPVQALANFYWSQGRRDDAETWIRKAVAMDAKNVIAQRMLATMLAATGRIKDAEQPLKMIAEAAPSTAADLALADYYVGENRLPEARSVLSRAARRTDGFSPATVRLATIDYMQDRPKQGDELLQSVLASDAKNVEALVALSRRRLVEGRVDDAQARAEAALAANVSSAIAHSAMADVHEVRGDFGAAMRSLTEVVRLNPRVITARLRLAELHIQRGDLKAANQLAEEARRLAPASAAARLMVVRAALQNKEVHRAETELAALAGAFPNDPTVHTRRGELELERGDREAARRSFINALGVDALSFDALRNLVVLDVQNNRPQDVRALLERQLQALPKDVARLFLAAGVYGALGDTTRQEATLNTIIEVDPRNIQAYVALARLYVEQRKLDQALIKYEALTRRDASAVAAHTMTGLILEAQNKPAEAMKAYAKALDLNPEAPVAANNLAWLQAEAGANLDVALQLAQAATRAAPQSHQFIDTLGWIYLKKGMAPQAADAFERALKLSPDNADYHYHLGMAHIKAGAGLKARAALGEALKLQPAHAAAKAALSSL